MAKFTVPSALWSSYEKMLGAVNSAAVASNGGEMFYRPAVASYFRRGEDSSSIVFECHLYLKNWRWRPGETKERVSIVIHARETLSLDAKTIDKSNVKVSYFRRKGDGSAALLHTTHFDYVGEQIAHPVFHAQLTEKPIIPPETETAEIRFDLQWDNVDSPCFANARIPTPDMTLLSVLLCLAADHIDHKFFHDMRATLRTIHEVLPRPKFKALRDSLTSEPAHFRSLHWFAHMPASPRK